MLSDVILFYSSLLLRLTLIIPFKHQLLGFIQPSVDQNTPTMLLNRVESTHFSMLEYLVDSLWKFLQKPASSMSVS